MVALLAVLVPVVVLQSCGRRCPCTSCAGSPRRRVSPLRRRRCSDRSSPPQARADDQSSFRAEILSVFERTIEKCPDGCFIVNTAVELSPPTADDRGGRRFGDSGPVVGTPRLARRRYVRAAGSTIPSFLSDEGIGMGPFE